MSEKIHYEDNLFFLASLIRTLSDAVKLPVDADYFAEKVLEDTLFIDLSIQKIYGSLKDNPYLIRRNSYFHTVMRLKRAYAELLEVLLTTQGDFSRPFLPVEGKLRRIAETHNEDAQAILKILQNEEQPVNSQDMISRDELEFLTSPMEESPELPV